MPSPIVTVSLQATVLSGASNIVAQICKPYVQKVPFSFDVYELLRFVVISLVTTPPNYKWQHFLERTFPATKRPTGSALPLTRKGSRSAKEEEDIATGRKPKLNVKNTALKWFLDCITMGALVNTTIFLILMGCLKGQSAEQIVHNVRTRTLPIIWDSYKIWPVASVINFAFVPVERRIVFLSLVGLIWGVYMSLVAAKV